MPEWSFTVRSDSLCNSCPDYQPPLPNSKVRRFVTKVKFRPRVLCSLTRLENQICPGLEMLRRPYPVGSSNAVSLLDNPPASVHLWPLLRTRQLPVRTTGRPDDRQPSRHCHHQGFAWAHSVPEMIPQAWLYETWRQTAAG